MAIKTNLVVSVSPKDTLTRTAVSYQAQTLLIELQQLKLTVTSLLRLAGRKRVKTFALFPLMENRSVGFLSSTFVRNCHIAHATHTGAVAVPVVLKVTPLCSPPPCLSLFIQCIMGSADRFRTPV